MLRRFASVQVRNAATIGGNIANGSPIGDGPPALIALGARVVLRQGSGDAHDCRWRSFFIAYGKQDRQPGEFVEAIEVPLLDRPERLKCYKISKRFDQDISAVLRMLQYRRRGRHGRAMPASATAAWPPRPSAPQACEAALVGRAWTLATVMDALPAFDRDYSPLTDMRGSAAYRSQAARNLLVKYLPRDATSAARDAPRRARSGVWLV